MDETTVAQWHTADAKNRFAELFEAPDGHGSQVVIRHADVVAVVLSPDDYRRLVRQANATFGQRLAQRSFAPEDMEPIGVSLSGGS